MSWTEIEAVLTRQGADGEVRLNCLELEWVQEAIHHHHYHGKLLDQDQAWRINSAFPALPQRKLSRLGRKQET